MSRYLQALVNTVAQPRQSVHPRTHSIFSPSRGEAAAEPALWEGERLPEETVASPSENEERIAIDPPPRRAEETHIFHAPLLPSTDAFLGLESLSSKRNGVDASDDSQTSTEQATGRPERRASHILYPVQESRPQDVRASNYGVHARPQRAGDNTPNTTSGRSLRSDKGASRQSQSDDIRIHIGRIEVTAVQAPTPPRSNTPENAISLNDYLERRNARTR